MNGVKRIQKVTAKAVIAGEGDTILLVQEHDGRWEFPGGKIEFGETAGDASLSTSLPNSLLAR